MSEVARPQLPKRRTLSVDLGAMRAPLLASCEARGVRPGEAIRSLVAASLRGATPNISSGSTPARDHPGVYEVAVKKLTIRLGASEYRQVAERAKRDGFTVSRWISSLLRNALTGTVSLNATEVQSLADSNGQLGAIGRNLNQVARALNSQDHRATAYDRELIEQIGVQIRAHRAAVSRLILASTERWQIGPAAER